MIETVPDGGIYTYAILFLVALALCALFSFLETSITAIRLYQLKELAQTPGRYEKLLKSLEKNQSRVLTTILLANNLANVVAATAGTYFMEKVFENHPSVGVPLGILLITAAILVIGEVIPKNIAKAFGERTFHSTLWITNLTYYSLYIPVSLFLALSDFIIYKIRGKHEEEEIITSEKEIRFLIDYINQKGLLEAEKTAMLKSIFELGTTSVKDILIPANSIVSISADTSVDDALLVFKERQFSRLPVYENRIDNIIGMLHLKDLFSLSVHRSSTGIKDILRPILFIPESIKVNQLLKEFKDQHMHIAMVLDEHGTIAGLVTLEDVLEEIVGEIQDEYEEPTSKISSLDGTSWLVDASIELKELETHLGIKFETEGAITLSGFLAEQLQHVPKVESKISYKEYDFLVQQASPTKALQVVISRQQGQ